MQPFNPPQAASSEPMGCGIPCRPAGRPPLCPPRPPYTAYTTHTTSSHPARTHRRCWFSCPCTTRRRMRTPSFATAARSLGRATGCSFRQGPGRDRPTHRPAWVTTASLLAPSRRMHACMLRAHPHRQGRTHAARSMHALSDRMRSQLRGCLLPPPTTLGPDPDPGRQHQGARAQGRGRRGRAGHREWAPCPGKQPGKGTVGGFVMGVQLRGRRVCPSPVPLPGPVPNTSNAILCLLGWWRAARLAAGAAPRQPLRLQGGRDGGGAQPRGGHGE